jgi:cob(I)alamin adenosyltransferase
LSPTEEQQTPVVYLNRIYTRTGDEGRTMLGDGRQVAKTDPRIAAYGTVDELNAVLGLVLNTELSDRHREVLTHVQNDLFDVGADLCVPETDSPPETPPLRVSGDQVTRLERRIDELNEGLQPLQSFILPGGTDSAARLHLARTVCRRAEIKVWRLAGTEPVNPEVPKYLNRLSDLLFVMARACNDQGRADVLWVPGQNRNLDQEGSAS